MPAVLCIAIKNVARYASLSRADHISFEAMFQRINECSHCASKFLRFKVKKLLLRNKLLL